MVTKYPESGIFFTSDTHFGHSKIIDYLRDSLTFSRVVPSGMTFGYTFTGLM